MINVSEILGILIGNQSWVQGPCSTKENLISSIPKQVNPHGTPEVSIELTKGIQCQIQAFPDAGHQSRGEGTNLLLLQNVHRTSEIYMKMKEINWTQGVP